MKNKHFYLLYIIWIFLIAASFLLNLYFIRRDNKSIIMETSRAFFQEILTTRAWNAQSGGVYIPVSDKVKPNEYLHDPKRDIVTTDGHMLTKINPAYMTRQIAEIALNKDGIQYHITSLNPIRPANKPDMWETTALQSFETGQKEQFDLVKQGKSKVFRYMAPLPVEGSCLKCHASQGYKTGDVRGGISITMTPVKYFEALEHQILILALLHAIIMLIGIGGISLFKRLLNKQFKVILKQNEELQKNIHTKDTLFSLVTHDLKSPLSGAMGLGEIVVAEGHTMSREEIIKINTLILKSVKSTYQLSEHLVTWYLAQKGTSEFDPRKTCLKTLIDSSIELISSRASEKKIKLTASCDPLIYVNADENMTFAVLRNLIGNAIKFTPRGGNVIISALNSNHEGFIGICVEDSGVGMSAETLYALSAYDIQKPGLGTENEKGTGIGLTLCKEFIKLHKGELTFESEKGKGSKITFTLPLYVS